MTTQTWRADVGPAPKRPHLVLLALPFIWQVGCIPLVNEVALRPFGMPFPMVWQMAGVAFASLIFALVFHLDRRAGLEEEEAAFIAATMPRKAAP
jgi:hypothetical protein